MSVFIFTNYFKAGAGKLLGLLPLPAISPELIGWCGSVLK